MMAWPQQEYPLVLHIVGDRLIRCCSHIAREIVSRMRYYQRCQVRILPILSMQRQEAINFLAQLPGITRIEAVRLGRRSYHRLLRHISVKCIHHL